MCACPAVSVRLTRFYPSPLLRSNSTVYIINSVLSDYICELVDTILQFRFICVVFYRVDITNIY